jgi:hypothetical protein
VGSFNVGCGISNISIEPGDKTGFVILNTGSGPERISPECGVSMLLNEYDLYRPYLPPLFGEYNDYGSIESIKKSKTTEFMEHLFARDIETIINCLTDNTILYDAHGRIFDAYFKGDKTFDKFGATHGESFLPLGFSKAKGKRGEEVFSLKGFEIVITKHPEYELLFNYSIRNAKTGEVLIQPFVSQFPGQALDAFGRASGIYPGYDKKDYSRIVRLRDSHGMFFSEDVFRAMTEHLSTDWFYGDMPAKWAKLWKEFIELPKKFGGILDNKDRQYTQVGRFVDTNTSFPAEDTHLLGFYGSDLGYLQLVDLMNVMRVTNRLFTPSFCGSQDGNTKASLALSEATTQILTERKKREEEWMEEDD